MGSLEKTWEASRKGTPPVSSARTPPVSSKSLLDFQGKSREQRW